MILSTSLPSTSRSSSSTPAFSTGGERAAICSAGGRVSGTDRLAPRQRSMQRSRSPRVTGLAR
ncbi:hypothetical protein [Thermomonas sp.]|uniref:hypothetical protein n=1 Tax=Thermomonas sp. TaxID=1971895 RepID=UPI001ED24E0E|nr:hypothetical protein [Thermomonas sp.]MBK6415368.1 hypothetical protein [Thermomonas sp.]